MTLSTVRPGDIVQVDRRGRTFYAFVAGHKGRTLAIVPLDPRINYYQAKANEVIGHWRKTKATAIRVPLRIVEEDDATGQGEIPQDTKTTDA